MIITQVICDFCGKPFRHNKRAHPNSKEVTVTGFARTKEWDTRDLFPHLCEGCAGKLDVALAACKNGMTKQALLADQFGKLNAERREKLGTNG